jgi:hypothetical protein
VKSVTLLLDLATIATALFAAWMWFRASSFTVRRISKHEQLDSGDFNRLITAMNRTQILNRRAALATAGSGLAIALKYLHDMVV